MKKFYGIIATLFLCTAIVGCNGNKQKTAPATEPVQEADTIPTSSISTVKAEENIADVSDMLVAGSLSISLDGKDAEITTYIHAEKIEDRFLLDDGQDWALYLTYEGDQYALFPRQYVQLGEVSYNAYLDIENDNTLNVIVTRTNTAELLIQHFIFEKESGQFTKTVLIHAPNINYMGNGPKF